MAQDQTHSDAELEFRQSFSGHSSFICQLCWSPSGEFVASASNDGTVRVWRPPHSDPTAVLSGHESGYVSSVVWSGDARHLTRFQQDHPDPTKVAFIMMRFAKTNAHEGIIQAIKSVLQKSGIDAVRADDKEYHDDLFPNILTYMWGCGMGIAVFERIEQEACC